MYQCYITYINAENNASPKWTRQKKNSHVKILTILQKAPENLLKNPMLTFFKASLRLLTSNTPKYLV